MILPIVKNKWEYEIHENFINYGYNLTIYKNGQIVHKQGGFGSISVAEVSARDYMLLNEFDIDRELE